MSTLYTIADSYKALLSLDIPSDALSDTLESIDGEIEDKMVNIWHVVSELRGDISLIDAEILRLSDRKTAMKKRSDGILDYVKMQMEKMGKSSIKTPLVTFTLPKSCDALVILDEKLIQVEFKNIKTVESIDKRALLASLQAGNIHTGAEIGKTKTSIRIK